MASRSSAGGKPSEGGRMTRQKQRSQPDQERGRAKGGGLRDAPTSGPPGRSASTGGLTTRGMARNNQNSRSSNAGKQHRQRVPRQP